MFTKYRDMRLEQGDIIVVKAKKKVDFNKDFLQENGAKKSQKSEGDEAG